MPIFSFGLEAWVSLFSMFREEQEQLEGQAQFKKKKQKSPLAE